MGQWKVEPTKRVYLPEDIADDLWIAVPHPKLMTVDQLKTIASFRSRIQANKDNDDLDTDATQELAANLVLDWNLPGADGNVLPLPSKDASVWGKLPAMAVFKAMFSGLKDAVDETEPDPNSSDGSDNT